MSAFYWCLAVASLVGVWLNIRKLRVCFAIWLVTNACWAGIDFGHGLPEQATLHLVYVGLAIHGLIAWRQPS